MTSLRLAALTLAATLPACAPPAPSAGPTSEESTGGSTTGQASAETGTATSSGPSSSEGETSSGDSSGSTGSTSPGDTSTPSSSGSTGSTDETSGSGTSSTGGAPFCGNLEVEAGEECDDGNLADGDGCSAACVVERWTHEGVATDVPLVDLKKWKPCFTSTYEAGAKIQDILDACNGDHILMGCRPVDGTALTIAAHAPRADVFFEPQVNYKNGERHVANGVAWYWAPYYGLIGFEPHLGNDWWYPCSKPDQVEQMCWVTAANPPDTLAGGYRCGEQSEFSVAESKVWLRVAYEAWD